MISQKSNQKHNHHIIIHSNSFEWNSNIFAHFQFFNKRHKQIHSFLCCSSPSLNKAHFLWLNTEYHKSCWIKSALVYGEWRRRRESRTNICWHIQNLLHSFVYLCENLALHVIKRRKPSTVFHSIRHTLTQPYTTKNCNFFILPALTQYTYWL